MKEYVGSQNIVFITFDTLRYDVAQEVFERGHCPNFARCLPNAGWEKRHTPGSFTYAAHQAFFAGFLPTPAQPGKHPRLFAAAFAGSETSDAQTFTFAEAEVVSALRARNYHTICVGGVGFFNQRTALSRVLPDLFDEAHWSEAMGVTGQASAQEQFSTAAKCINALPSDQRFFLFINLSAMHQPNYFFQPDRKRESGDDKSTMAAALQHVDSEWPALRDALLSRGPSFNIWCSDHGTAYGEDGFEGHRLAHQSVWEVPYAEFMLTH